MSMKVLTVLQFISIFTIYTGLFIAVPALLLHRRLKDEIFSVRFFFYIVLGHFYLINLVLFLQLLHISGRFTLILGSALPVVISLVHTKRVSPKKIGHIIGNRTSHVIRETLGIKLLLLDKRRLRKPLDRCLRESGKEKRSLFCRGLWFTSICAVKS